MFRRTVATRFPNVLPATRSREFRFQLLLALVQALQAKLPAMKLDAELIDVAGDLGSLGFVFLQLMLKIGNFNRVFGGRFHGGVRNGGWFAALLAIQGHSRRGGIDDERRSAMRAGEDDVAARFRD